MPEPVTPSSRVTENSRACDRVAEGGGGGLLVGGEGFAGVVGVGDGEGRGDGEDGGEQQAGVGHASDHAGGDAGGAGQVAGGAGFGGGQGGQDFLAGFGDAGVGRRFGGALPAGGWRGDAGGDDAERHRHDLAGRGQGVAGDPVDELAQRRAHGGRVDQAG